MSKQINHIETDFKAEVVASQLIKNGQEEDKVLILRRKGDKRVVAKDIDKVELQISPFDMQEYLHIYTLRKSIYDSLPESLFHSVSNTQNKSKDDIINEIKKHREEEIQARKYFQPFEMLIDKMLVEAQMEEEKFYEMDNQSHIADVLKNYWSILNFLSPQQTLIFIKIIPMLTEISQSKQLIAETISVLIDCQVSISIGEKQKVKLAIDERIRLGKGRLGVNFIIGNTIEINRETWIINVEIDSDENIKHFKSNKTKDFLLKELMSLIIPLDVYSVVKYKSKKPNLQRSQIYHLGINTHL